MGDGRPLGIPALADGSEKGCNRRSDIVAEQDRNGPGQADDRRHPVGERGLCKALQNGDGRGRRLNDEGHDKAEQEAQGRHVSYLSHELCKDGVSRQGLHGPAHDLYAFEEEAEVEDDAADIPDLLVLREEDHEEADEENGEDVVADIEGDELGRHRRSDIRPEDDENSLGQAHEAGGNEADRHDRRRAGTLQYGRHQGPGQYAEDGILREEGKHFFHLLPAGLLQVGTHFVHSQQKHGQPAEQTEDRRHHFIHCFNSS